MCGAKEKGHSDPIRKIPCVSCFVERRDGGCGRPNGIKSLQKKLKS